MSYHPRIEEAELANFLSTRTRGSRLWFVNNAKLENEVLKFAAKYSTTREVKLYGLAIEGSHIHIPALFPKGNRSDFARDFNGQVAKSVQLNTPEYDGCGVWARRYSNEFLPSAEDIEEYFFYTVLQPVQDGLVEKLGDYPGYNCFSDAVRGIGRKFKVVDWKRYNWAKKRNPRGTDIRDYTVIYTLKYERIPGYEELSQRDYSKLMHEKLERRRVAIVNKRRAEGKGFLGRDGLLGVKRGSRPRSTKTSTISSHRPRILSICPKRRAEYKAWYFGVYFAYKEASARYRAGEIGVEFPAGTYRPPTRYIKPKDPPGAEPEVPRSEGE